MDESEIHFKKWIYQKKEKNGILIIPTSLLIHAFIFLILNYIHNKPEVTLNQNPASIHINFTPPKILKQNTKLNEKNKENKSSILTDKNPVSKSKFYSHKKTDKPATEETEIKPKQFFTENNNVTNENRDIDNSTKSFLPNGNPNYLNSLRSQNEDHSIHGDGGDIPLEGPSLAPTNQPRVISRYSEKDMSLFQFTQEFRERFGAIWNAEERIVPPTSPLKPGDLVYYKIFINSDGSLQKFENQSRPTHPLKDYSDLDKIFNQVIAQVLPMSVPPKFANKHLVLTQIVAIQVVDRNMPVRFSF